MPPGRVDMGGPGASRAAAGRRDGAELPVRASRRQAAGSIAGRQIAGSDVGGFRWLVGYKVRFNDRTGPNTRVKLK